MFDVWQRRIIQDHQHTPWLELWRQPLAMLIRMPWPVFVIAMASIYVLEVLLFALVLHTDRRSLMGTPPSGMPIALAFAMESFFANAFNGITPGSLFTYAVGMIDLIVGLITLSFLTALVFARFSGNESPLVFSRYLCLSNLNDGHLFCRFVTSDRSQWLQVHYSLSLIMDHETEPGLWQRRVVPLELLNGSTPQLSQTATLSHPLNERSPIRGLGLEELQRRHAVLMPLVEGRDETTGASLMQTHLYSLRDILLDHRFDDLVRTDASGAKRVIIRRLNEVVALGSAQH